MRTNSRPRSLTLAVAVLACLSTSVSLPTVAAAPRSDVAIRDGTPDAATCARLGFVNYGQDADDGRAFYARRGAGGALHSRGGAPLNMPAPPPPAPPPPPALNIAPVEHPAPGQGQTAAAAQPPVGSLTVTARRRTEAIQGVPVTGYPNGPPAGAMDTERYPHAASNPIHRVADDPVSTFSIDVDTASYSNVRRFLNDGQAPPHDAVRVEEMVNYFDYHYPQPAARETPFRLFTAVTPSPWSPGKQIIHVGVQGYDLPRAQQPPLNLVFLIDTSGSMSPEDRLPLAIKSLNMLVGQLGPRDRVAIVAYAGSAGEVLAPTSGGQRLRICCALGSLHSGGSTAGGAGLELAYKLAQQSFRQDAANRVILMTDGDFNVGIADPERLKDFVAARRGSGVYLSVYGFGRNNYNDVMMQNLAQNGNGTAAYVDTLQEAAKLFRHDFDGAMVPIADDVKIQVEFNPARVSEYRLVGYETRMLNREDFNNDRVDAGEVGAGASVTALYEITPVGGARASDPLRYQPEAAAPQGDTGGELAFLKLRYKPPRGHDSRLIQRPIGAGDVYRSLEAAPEATRWAIAVASYGQRLRGDPWIDEHFGWPQIGALAQSARGADTEGLRAEFIQLTHKASEEQDRAASDGTRPAG